MVDSLTRPGLVLATLLLGATAAHAQSIRQSANCAARRRPAPAAEPGAARPDPLAGTPAIPELPAPSRLIAEFGVVGDLLEDIAVVRGFFAGVIPIGQPADAQVMDEISERARRLGYLVKVLPVPLDAARVRLVLNLRPVTLVRHIDIAVNWDLLEEAIFSEELRRHLHLRAGSALSDDPADQAGQLCDEELRMTDFLRNQGFFEASVRITVEPDGENAARLRVRIEKGPAYSIGVIKVEGNVEIPSELITERFRHGRLFFFTRRFNREQLKVDVEAVVAMYQRRGFPGVRVSTDFDFARSFRRRTRTVEFTVIVRERRRVEVYFEGQRALSESVLRGALTFNQEGSYHDVDVEDSAKAVRRVYQSRGYYEAAVGWERVSFRLPDQVIDHIIFHIAEGPRLKVRQISISGNQALPTERLRAVVTTREFPRFELLTSGGYATSNQLKQDAERIAAVYKDEGFPDVEVEYDVSRDPRLLDNAAALAAAIVSELPAQGLFVRFRVIEGQRRVVDGVEFTFKGDHDLDAAALAKQVRLGPGVPYTDVAAAADRARLKRLYFERGYPHADVVTVPQLDPETGAVTVVHEVEEVHRVRFGQLAVRGNFKTVDWVLLEEAGIDPGAAFTLSRADLAQFRLRTSGLFSNVSLDFVGTEQRHRDVIPVIMRVEERYDHTAEVLFGGGYSTDTRGFLEGAYTMPNIGGWGLALDLRAQAGQEIQLADLKLVSPRWIQRHLVGVGLRLESAAFLRREEKPRFGPLTSYGFSLAGLREGTTGFFAGWFLGLRYDFRIRNRDEDVVRNAGANDDLTEVPLQTTTGAIGPQLVIDKRTDEAGRRNPLAPEGGFKLALSAQVADQSLSFGIGADRFVKLGFEGQHYWKLGKRFLLTNGVRYDHGVPLGGVLLPETERYFAGGDTTVRGIEEDRLLTEIIQEPLPPLGDVTQFRVVPAGGNIRFIHNLDLQVQVWNEPLAGFPVASAIFLDTGLVTNSLYGFEVEQLRHSLGIAFFRWVTPFGSLSFEYAIPLDPQLGDNPRGRFHFNFGFVLN